jgi:REP element-mobilizing transposase RayT
MHREQKEGRRRELVQLDLPLRKWGGRRAGAGRKPASQRAGVPHRVRPNHSQHYPVHVTMRAERLLPSLRKQVVFVGLRQQIAKASRSFFRVVHFSVQSNHVHIIVEAHDKLSLSRGMAGLSIRLARSVNRILGRRGRVWNERYHARALRSPRETRHGLVYVLMNFKKHIDGARGVDVLSSAIWFDGWKAPLQVEEPPEALVCDDIPVARPRTWLARKGWRRYGLVGQDERPTKDKS